MSLGLVNARRRSKRNSLAKKVGGKEERGWLVIKGHLKRKGDMGNLGNFITVPRENP